MAQDNNETYYLFLFLKFSTTEPLGKVIKISVLLFSLRKLNRLTQGKKRTMWVTKKRKKKIERNWHDTETTRQVCSSATDE